MSTASCPQSWTLVGHIIRMTRLKMCLHWWGRSPAELRPTVVFKLGPPSPALPFSVCKEIGGQVQARGYTRYTGSSGRDKCASL